MYSQATHILAIGIPSGPELILILAVLVLLFGAKKIPDLGRALGSGIRNFKKGISGGDDDDEDTPKKLEGEKRGQLPPPKSADGS